MSRANEIVSMLTGGRERAACLLPPLLIGLLTTGVTLALNYALAAHAERARKNFFDENNRGGPRDVVISGQIFRNRTDNRTWFIPRFRPGTNKFNSVQIVQQDGGSEHRAQLSRERRLLRSGAENLAASQAKMVNYDRAGNITDEKMAPDLRIKDWSETPYRLSSANVRPEFLGIDELARIPALQLPIFRPTLARAFSDPARSIAGLCPGPVSWSRSWRRRSGSASRAGGFCRAWRRRSFSCFR